MRFTPRRDPRARRTSAWDGVERLEPRRLLANAYPLINFAGHMTTQEPSPRASVNGEAFGSLVGQMYRSDGSADGSAFIATRNTALHDWDGDLYFGAAANNGFDSFLQLLHPGSTVPAEVRDPEGRRLSPRQGSFVPVGDRLFFGATTASNFNPGVYVTDRGSRVARLTRTGNPIGRAGDVLVFSSNSNGSAAFNQLWRSDGTDAGTVRIRDNFSVPPTGFPGQDLGNVVLFNGPGGLWKSDGTDAGTALVRQGAVAGEWHRVGDAAYFLTPARPSNLWKTDGTTAGTVLLGPALSGANLPIRSSPSMARLGNTLYYVNADGSIPQLFATEGPGTTRRITNLGTNSFEGVQPVLAAVGDRLLFSARAGNPDFQLWESTGAVGNATPVPGQVLSDGRAIEYGPLNFLPVGGSLFFTHRMYNGPTRLWRYGVAPSVLDEDGVLVINGTDPAEGVPGNDQIVVSRAGDSITATVNGATASFPLSGVRRITVNGLGETDTVSFNGLTTVPFTFNGGGGQDVLNVLGTSGDDVVSVTSAPNAGPGGSLHTSSVDRVTLDTLGGADRVTLTDLRHAMTLHGGEGDDVLVFDDAARMTDDSYDLSDTGFGRTETGGGVVPTLLLYDGVESVTLGAGPGVSRVTVAPSATTTFSVNGNAPAPPALGSDLLGINVRDATGTRHTPGAAAGAGQWTFADRRPVTYTGIEATYDNVPLTGHFTDVTPNPRRDPVSEVRIVFSEPVTGFDLADLRLFRDGGPNNLLSAAQTLTTTDNITWTLGNLAGLTTPDGRYTLALPAAGSGIVDAVGSPLAFNVAETFTVDNVAPTADVEDVSPDVRTEPVDSVRVVFSEPVTGLTLGHFTLTREGGPNLLTAAQALTRVNDTTYAINNLSALTRAAGRYVLTLQRATAAAPQVEDLAGNPLAADASDFWRNWALVRGRHVFYNGSARDGFNSAANGRDDDAIAPDKLPLLPGQLSSFANYTSYDRGLNGVMVDMTGLPSGLTAADFEFRAGNLGSPAGWGAAPPPASISVRPGAGVDGADRVTLTWPDNAIRNRWLQVRLLPTTATGLPSPGDVFYFGNLGGETGNFPRGVGHKVDPGDLNATRAHVAMRDLPLTYRWDHNRDGWVSPADLAAVLRNLRAAPLRMFTAPLVGGLPSAASQPVVVPAEANAGSSAGGFVNVNGTIFFAADDGVHGLEPWMTDGTPQGTVMVADVNPGPASSSPRQFENVGGVAVFAADDGTHGEEPWRSDGTPAGTYLLDDVNPGRDSSDPWAPSSYDGSRRAIVIGGVMYFFANRPGEGYELWRTDGTAYGTWLVRDVNPGATGSHPEGMTDLNGRLLFTAHDGAGRAMWASGGRAANTAPVGGETNLHPVYMTAWNGHVYFRTATVTGADRFLRRTDGTAAGTSVVKELPGTVSSFPVDADGRLFMIVHSFEGTGGYELWKSDGTTDGTVRVRDAAGPVRISPTALVGMNGVAYFLGSSPETGWELWRSDGTEAGTYMVRDIDPGPAASLPSSLTVVDGLLYFTAVQFGTGRQVWRSDGTEAGTVRLTGELPGVGELATFAKKDNYVYFAAPHPAAGFELWRTDGTPAGTVLFKDINEEELP